MRARIAVLASGRGSNVQAILDYLDRFSGSASYEVTAVLSNRSDAPVLDLARKRGIDAISYETAGDPDGEKLLSHLSSRRIDIVALAGYLRKIPAAVVAAYAGRMVNVHPALLPRHGGAGMYGMRVHESVLSAGERESGVTVHLVDSEYDRGAIVAQWKIPVLPGDDAHSLAERVLAAEHTLYPRTLDIIAALNQLNSKE